MVQKNFLISWKLTTTNIKILNNLSPCFKTENISTNYMCNQIPEEKENVYIEDTMFDKKDEKKREKDLTLSLDSITIFKFWLTSVILAR